MSKPLRVLIIEDSADDATLLTRELRRGGYDVSFERVETAKAMTTALARRTWDLIVADYTLPRFSGIAALERLKETGLDIPFIIVSGSIGEELAVAAMKAGAHDYLMKGNIHRLLPSVERELRDAEVRRQHRRAEEALHDSEARKAAIFDSALDSIITMDHQGNIAEFNPEAEKMFGYNRHEVIGRPMAELMISPSLRDRHQRALAHYLATGEGPIVGKRIESTAMHRDGAEFPVELAVTRISQKGPPLFTAYIRDLTEQKRQEEIRRRSRELEEQNLLIKEASRLKNEFLANMSHELRTPLNAVIGFAEVLIDEKAGPLSAAQREYLSDILAGGRHLLELINDVLDLAKIEAGKMELDLATFSIKEVVDEVCSIIRPMAAKKGIPIEVETAPDIDRATLDQRKFRQILYNLLSNAVKFSPEQRPVKVIARLDAAERLVVQVQDGGIGIKKEDLPRLFREFEQLDSSPSRRQQGTGLGLALTKKFVELQKGAISVESEPGKGSRFNVVLPISYER